MNIKILEDGMLKEEAESLWEKIEGFAAYSFNKSHAVEYSIISYWSMWLKVNYPAEFYAAAMSVLKEDKLSQLVLDAQARNIHVVPPEINHSGMDFIIEYDPVREQTILYTPFNRLKGLSDNTTRAILEAREKRGVPFVSKEDFLDAVNKTKCNKRHQEVLTRVGAFSEIELGAGGLSARHPDRLKDQLELMPGLIVEHVKADRAIVTNKAIKGQIAKIIMECKHCTKCDLAGGVHPTPSLGRTPKFMVVSDNPSKSEAEAKKMFSGDSTKFTKESMKSAMLNANDAYFTSLVKSPKKEKQLTNDQINGCSEYLKREVEILKPPVIVALGGNSIRHFVPDAKGGIGDLSGKVVYVPDLDASVIFGINPAMIYFEPSRQAMLDETFEKAAELVLTK